MRVGMPQHVPVMLRVLRAQFIDPPLRVRIATRFRTPHRGEDRFTLSQKVAQHTVDEAFGGPEAERKTCAYCVIDYRVGRGARVHQLIKRDAKQMAHTIVCEWPFEHFHEHAVDLAEEAQRSVCHILQRCAVLRGEMCVPAPH
jgi:hypothetical protein